MLPFIVLSRCRRSRSPFTASPSFFIELRIASCTVDVDGVAFRRSLYIKARVPRIVPSRAYTVYGRCRHRPARPHRSHC